MTFPRPTARTVTAALLLAASPVMAQWQKLPPMPEASGGFTCGTDGAGIVVMGGTNWKDGAKHWLQTISRFDPTTMRWDSVGKLDEPLAYAACSARQSDGALIILGGSNGKAPAQTIIVVAKTVPSPEPAPALPRQIVLSAGGVIGDAFIVAGGTDDAANIGGFTSRAFAWDLKKKTITALPDYPGRPFGMAATAVLGEELFVFAGANWNETSKGVADATESHAFSKATGQWRKLKPYPLAARGPTAVALDERRIYIAGGCGGEPEGFLSAAFIYDRQTDSYTMAPPLPYSATVGLVRLEGFVYCCGGEDAMKSRTNAAWRIREEDLTK